jgi:hypothetical protein
MARRLAKFPSKTRRGGAPRKPQLDQWLDGNPWRLEQGVDFETSIHVFQGELRKAASRRGKRFRYSDQGNGVVVIQAYSRV